MSEFVHERLLERGVSDEKIELVHGSIDIQEFKAKRQKSPARTRRELGITDEHVFVLMVGHVRWWKGQHVLLEALNHLSPSTLARLRVAFAGGVSDEAQEYRQRLEEYIHRHSLEDVVKFLGHRDDVPDLLEAADIAIHASVRPEPFGLVVLEAMAAGTPIIAADRGGPREILEHDTGLTFDPEDPEQLAERLARLLEDEKDREGYARRGRARVEEFSRDRMVGKVGDVWKEILEES